MRMMPNGYYITKRLIFVGSLQPVTCIRWMAGGVSALRKLYKKSYKTTGRFAKASGKGECYATVIGALGNEERMDKTDRS